mgnify:CR=1 FL=1
MGPKTTEKNYRVHFSSNRLNFDQRAISTICRSIPYLTSQDTPLQPAEIENRCLNIVSLKCILKLTVFLFACEPGEMFAEMNLSLCFRSTLFHICLFVVFCI